MGLEFKIFRCIYLFEIYGRGGENVVDILLEVSKLDLYVVFLVFFFEEIRSS